MRLHNHHIPEGLSPSSDDNDNVITVTTMMPVIGHLGLFLCIYRDILGETKSKFTWMYSSYMYTVVMETSAREYFKGV